MTHEIKALDVRSKMVGVLLRSARLKAGKTLKDCAKLLACSPHTMSQYEHGRKGISMPELELLASFFDVPVNYFWKEEPIASKERADLPPAEKMIPLRQKIIGVLLRGARQKAGKTLKDCAELLGCSSYMISQYEYGHKGIPLSELEILAGFFDVPVSYFWEEDSTVLAEGVDLPPSEQLIPIRQKMIGVLLRQARLEAGKTQEECAEALGVSTDTISKYEYGKKPIPFPQLEILGSLLEVPLSHFLDSELATSDIVRPESQRELLSVEDAWARLPREIQEFIRTPDSLPYLQIVLKLYELPRGSLEDLAKAILPAEE
jgi:transcriptional regulator with XRE-family HTH domain